MSLFEPIIPITKQKKHVKYIKIFPNM